MSILSFAAALAMFATALRLPAWHFTTANFPDGGETHHTWSGLKCLQNGFMFYPSNLLLLGMSICGLIVTVLDVRRAAEDAHGISPWWFTLLAPSLAFVLVCAYFVGPLETPGCGLWMGAHLACTAGAAIRVYEVAPYRRRDNIHVQQLEAGPASRIEVDEPWRSIASLRGSTGAPLDGEG
jgi:hypothetical protein